MKRENDTETTNDVLTVDSYQNDRNIAMQRVKPEFRLTEEEIQEHINLAMEYQNQNPSDSVQNHQKKKRRGQNKAKERVNEKPRDLKLCFAVSVGNPCETENCRFYHDVEKYLEMKGPDLGPNCPIFDLLGNCKYGVKCRFSKCHTGENYKPIQKDNVLLESQFIKNTIPRDFQKQARNNSLKTEQSDAFEAVYQKHYNKKSEVKSEVKENDAFFEQKRKDFEDDYFKELKLRPQEKKRLDFKGKSYLAPLTTVGNLPFRRICKGFGVDITCAEMTLAQNLLQGAQTEWPLLRRHASEDFFGVQITGNHPCQFTKVCDIVNQYFEVDFVDINVGCPVEAITCKGSGSALMERRTRLRQMVQGAKSVLDCPITVKIRTGIKSKSPFAHTLIGEIERWGADVVTIHGRSKEQRYTKLADWDYIDKCGANINRTVEYPMQLFGNGDIFNPEDYTAVLNERKNIDGVMIGRGALIKPWIFKEIQTGQVWDISATERFDLLKDFGKYGMEFWGTDTMGINQTRKFMCEWLSFLHRYVPVGILEVIPQKMNFRPERFKGRNELETLLSSDNVHDWIKLTERVLGPASDSFSFIPKHKSNSYETEG
ncbi:tRNA-dihydrouridine(47) synthase [NAD(P)(+)] [Globomyces pollinis-pini]|nr:tRNA-dihydrouridine(47) synthase [NAD(P)(+)] [Globomyces pollinis-pini]